MADDDGDFFDEDEDEEDEYEYEYEATEFDALRDLARADCSGHYLVRYSTHRSIRVRVAVASHSKLSSELGNQLMDDVPEVREALASNPHTPLEVLFNIARSRDEELQALIAANPVEGNSPGHSALFTWLIAYGDAELRPVVAANPACWDQLLYLLASDPDERVRKALMANQRSFRYVKPRVEEIEGRLSHGIPEVPVPDELWRWLADSDWGTPIRNQDTDSVLAYLDFLMAINTSNDPEELRKKAVHPVKWVRWAVAKNRSADVDTVLKVCSDEFPELLLERREDIVRQCSTGEASQDLYRSCSDEDFLAWCADLRKSWHGREWERRFSREPVEAEVLNRAFESATEGLDDEAWRRWTEQCEAASNPETPPSLLLPIARKGDEYLRLLVASNSGLEDEFGRREQLFLWLIVNGSLEVRRVVAGNRRCPEYILTLLASDADERVRTALWKTILAPHDARREAARVEKQVASNKAVAFVPDELWEWLLDAQVLDKATSGEGPAGSKSAYRRFASARKSALTHEKLAKLSHHQEKWVRWAVGKNLTSGPQTVLRACRVDFPAVLLERRAELVEHFAIGGTERQHYLACSDAEFLEWCSDLDATGPPVY